MHGAMTLMAMIAGMFFSLCCALLVEELLFGGLFRVFFGPAQTQVSATRNGRAGECTKPSA